MATRVGPTTFCVVPLNRPRQHITFDTHVSSTIVAKLHVWRHNDAVQYDRCKVVLRPIVYEVSLTSRFLGVRGPKSKIEEQRFVECHMKKWRPKMALFHRETKKKNRFKGAWQMDRQTESIVVENTDLVLILCANMMCYVNTRSEST